MNVLVLNCGSSSLKYQLINMETKDVLATGLIERIGMKDSIFNYTPKGGEKMAETFDIPDHEVGIKHAFEKLLDPKVGVIKNLKEIVACGHRVVHGGSKFSDSVLINNDVIKAIEECIPFAPLHNPANLMGIKAIQHVLPGVPNVAVFDTAFHQTIPAVNHVYGIPYEYYEKHGIRKYSFHGTSHKYVTEKCAEFLNIPLKQFNAITCHLGNGCSMTAVKEGQSYDSTLGLKTIGGLVMGTRVGDVDPGLFTHLMKVTGMTADQIEDLYTKKSGLLGISGVSSDMRDIEGAAEKGNQRAQLALDIFAQRVIQYIGGYTATLGRVDAIIFTAGVGENAISMREKIVSRLTALGVKLDKEKNNTRGKLQIISANDSSIKVIVVPTNEELMIALDTQRLAK